LGKSVGVILVFTVVDGDVEEGSPRGFVVLVMVESVGDGEVGIVDC
jgi:hypothetical protein